MVDSDIIIGSITRTHGIRGEVVVFPLTSFPERFRILKKIILESKRKERVELTLERIRYNKKGYLIIGFTEIDSIEEIEPFVKGLIKIPQEEVLDLPEGYFYHFEIIGLKVYSEEGRYIGIIEDILSARSNDIYIVRNLKKEYLIPAVKEIVISIDVIKKRMTIHIVKGLLGDDEM